MNSPSTISKSVKFGLYFAGIWPGTPYSGVQKAFWVIAMGLLQTYQYEYVITRFRIESLMILIDSLTIAISFSLVCIKLIVAWINHR